MGFIMPAVRILDNVQLEANTYVIKIKEVDAGNGRIFPNQYMVMDPAGGQVQRCRASITTEPTFGLPATWIDAGSARRGAAPGYTVVDPATVIATHLTEIIKNNMSELLSFVRGSEAPEGSAEGASGIWSRRSCRSRSRPRASSACLQLLLAERVSRSATSATILEGHRGSRRCASRAIPA
jgi:flagellar biosynthesis protein FlhA